MAIEVVTTIQAPVNLISLPARLAGDLMLISALRTATSSTSGPSVPSGFTVLAEGLRARLYYQIATENAAASTQQPNWTTNSVTALYRGVDPDDPFGTVHFGPQESRTSVSVPPVVADPEVALLTFMLLGVSLSSVFTPPPFSGFETGAYGVRAYAGHKESNATDGGTITLSADTMSSFAMVALRPAGGTPARRRSPLMLTPW